MGRLLWHAIVAVAALAEACSSSTTPPAACTGSADCEPGRSCVDGRCIDSGDGGEPFADSGRGRPDAPPASDAGRACGDGVVDPAEACDDGNAGGGDGCSADCTFVETGFACPRPGEPCVSLVRCGDGELGGDEECDDRNAEAGDGCDALCRLEPGWTCPRPGLPCTAAACGDGIIAGGEECEDGGAPPESGDGCDAACRLEEGWACDAPGMPCRRTTCGDGVAEGTEECDDANHDLGDGCDPFCRREPRCAGGTCMAVCGDGLRLPGEGCDDGNARGGDGCSAACEVEPGFECDDALGAEPPEVRIPIVYRDFRGRDLPGGHPDFEWVVATDRGIVAAMLGADGKPVYSSASTTPTTNGRAFFDQWYRDTPDVNVTVVERLVLDRTGPGTYVFDSDSFFPLDGRGWVASGMEPARTGGHNFHFTSELRYWFEYAGGETLTFRGDDDVWVFINGRLAVDIGGVHPAQSAGITLGPAEAMRFGLRVGGIYEAVVFQAERHTTQSSYRLTLRNFRAPRSECDFICGDGIVTRFEICDDGRNDGSYGSCTPDCLGRGPHCGDGVVQSEEGERCDDGMNLGGYGMCGPGCRLGPRCGDGIVQAEFGEECDDGNTTSGDGCDAACQWEIV